MTIRSAPLWLLAGAMSGWGPAAEAQAPGTVTGVLRADRGGLIEGVEVLVQRTSLKTLTGPNGRFRLTEVPAGIQVFVFRKIGFRPQAITVAVEPEERTLGVVVLEAGAFRLPEITVTARYAKPERYANTTKYDDFYRRRRVGGGIFLDRGDLDRRFSMHTHELLQGLPGVHVDIRAAGTGSMLWFSRCNESPPAIALFVDGRQVMPPWGLKGTTGFRAANADENRRANRGELSSDAVDERVRFVDDMLNTVNPGDIEAIEVFKGPGQLPGEFNLGNNCGAIVIWTRQGGFRVEPGGR